MGTMPLVGHKKMSCQQQQNESDVLDGEKGVIEYFFYTSK
jgi:hypothetical protein